MRTLRRKTATLLLCAMLTSLLAVFASGAGALSLSETTKDAQASEITITATGTASPTSNWKISPENQGASITAQSETSATVKVEAKASGKWTISDDSTTQVLIVKPVGQNKPTTGTLGDTVDISTLLSGAIGTGTLKVKITELSSDGTLTHSSDGAVSVGKEYTTGNLKFARNTGSTVATTQFKFKIVDSSTSKVESDEYIATITPSSATLADPKSYSVTATAGITTAGSFLNISDAGMTNVADADMYFITKLEITSAFKNTTSLSELGALFSTSLANVSTSAPVKIPKADLANFKFTPPSGNDVGQLKLTYHVENAANTVKSSDAVITINVRPYAASNTYYVTTGGSVSISDILGLARYPSAAGTPTFNIKSGPSSGSISGSPFSTYTPNSSFSGTDTVRYTIKSNGMESALDGDSANYATLTFYVSSNYTSSNSFQTSANTQLTGSTSGTGNLIERLGYKYDNGNGTKIDTSNFTVAWDKSGVDTDHTAAITTSAFTLSDNGYFTFTPPTGQSGVVKLNYKYYQANNSGTRYDASVLIDVRPKAESATYYPTAGTQYSISSTDAKARNIGSNLRANVVSSPTRGTLTLNTDGTFTYTPTAGMAGADSFTYRLTDTVANLTSDIATVTFNVANATVTPSPVPTLAPANDVGIAVTGESDWPAYLLYVVGAAALLMGARAVVVAMRRLRRGK